MPHATVCLLRNFCPLCFRGSACSPCRVPAASTDIDQEQAECSKGNGTVPLLDMRAEGTACDPPCKFVCLICGGVMALACEPEFEQALDAVEKHEEEELELRMEVQESMPYMRNLAASMAMDLEHRFAKQLFRLGMAFHPRWKRLVHHACLRRAPCNCLLTRFTETCPKHPRSKQKYAARKQRCPPDTKKDTSTTTPASMTMPPAQTSSSDSRKASVSTITTASWLKRPTTYTSVQLAPTTAPPCVYAAYKPKPKPKESKPNPRLQAAASGCSKLDVWTTKQEASVRPLFASATLSAFCPKAHERDFDPFKHGYWRVNGNMVYRFPDGRSVPVFSAVNELTNDGQLVPK